MKVGHVMSNLRERIVEADTGKDKVQMELQWVRGIKASKVPAEVC